MGFQDLLAGKRIFLLRKLPITIVIIPAIVNLKPAKKICDAVSVISKRLYPILTKGNALPHKAQQIIAIMQTINLLVNKLFFIFFTPYVKL